MPTKPYPYQNEDALAIEKLEGRALLAADMGTGKTFVSLLWAHRNPDVRPIVIVCPASLKWNWQAECLRHFGWHAEVLEGTKADAEKGLIKPNIVILNYDILKYWQHNLKELRPQLVIVDETSYLANAHTQRTKEVWKLCKTVPHVIALSGTPLTIRPAELWPTLKLLHPKRYGAFYPFGQKFCAPKMTPWGMDYRGASNLDQLHTELKDVMIRRRIEDALPFLPEKTRIVLPLDMDRTSAKEYTRASIDLIGWLQTQSLARAKKASKAEKLVRVGYLKQLAAKGKMAGVIDWVDTFLSSGKKLVLFGVHKTILRGLYQRYRNTCVIVDGSVRKRERQLAVDQFQNDRKTNLFLGNLQAAGMGLNLFRADTIGFLEFGWSPGIHNQAEARIYRNGQTKKTFSWWFVARNTIEERIAKLLQERQEVLSATLDGGPCKGDLDIFNLLLQELEKEELHDRTIHSQRARGTQAAVQVRLHPQG